MSKALKILQEYLQLKILKSVVFFFSHHGLGKLVLISERMNPLCT